MVTLSSSLSVELALAHCAYLNKLEVPDLEEPNDDGHDHEPVDDGVVHVNQQHRDQVETLLNTSNACLNMYCMSKKSCSFLYLDSLYLNGHAFLFLDIQ